MFTFQENGNNSWCNYNYPLTPPIHVVYLVHILSL